MAFSSRKLTACLAFLVLAGLSAASFLRERAATLSPAARSRQAFAVLAAPGKPKAWLEDQIRALAYRDPLQAAGFAAKGFAAMQGDQLAGAKFAPLFEEALRRQPTFEPPRLSLAIVHATSGNRDQAVVQLDRLLSLNNGLVEPILPVLVALLADPAGKRDLMQRMASYPGWRTPVLLGAAKTGQLQPAEIERLLDAPAPANAAAMRNLEREGYLKILAQNGKLADAYRLFARYERLSPNSPVFDGAFKQPKKSGPFGWRLADQAEDYSVRVTDSGGNAIVRAHASGKFNVPLLAQTIGLVPGAWQIALKARDGGLAKPMLLSMRLTCQSGGQQLAEVSLGKLGPEPQVIKLPVAVPEACALQELAIFASEGEGGASEIEILSIEAGRP